MLLLMKKCHRIFLYVREKRNPLKVLMLGYVLLKSLLLRYLFGIDKLVSYFPRLDNECTKAVLKLFGAKIGADCFIGSNILIHGARADFRNLRIGNACHIGKETVFDLSAPIVIENCVTIALRATIITHISVGKSLLTDRYHKESAPVRIKNDAYIGVNSTILKGVTIGEGSLVAAGSLVREDVPDRTVVGGVPAKVIKNLSARAARPAGESIGGP